MPRSHTPPPLLPSCYLTFLLPEKPSYPLALRTVNTTSIPVIEINNSALPELQVSGKRAPRKATGALAKVTAIAVGVDPAKKIAKSSVAAFLKSTGIDLAGEIAKWPEYSAKPGEILEIAAAIDSLPLVRKVYLVGIGEGNLDAYRKVGAALGRKIKGGEISLLHGLPKDATSEKNLAAHVAALAISQYQWNLKSDAKKLPSSILIQPERDAAALQKDLDRAHVVASAVWSARDLVHTPSNIKNPDYLAKQALRLAGKVSGKNVTVKVRAGKELAEFGGVRAVGNSSPKPGPRVIEISYKPRGSANLPHVVLVGKGITFDTGGISLKRPYDTMMAMKSDMAGAAAVLATTLAVAELGAKVRVTGLMMCTENALSATSQRPSDVITHFGGKTVEVLNTDAEGRLVLADGLAYADLKLDPDYLVDIATLTGSATLGLGRQYAAMYTRNEKLAKKLYELGQRTGDRVWHMPLIDDYKSSLVSDIADINHTADKGNFNAGSVTAALFLEEFVGKRNWIHLDIAGTGRSEVDAGENVKGGTGFGVRLLTEWIASL